MRRFVSVFLMLVLLSLVGYNAWQITILRREITVLQTQMATLRADRAREEVRKGDIKQARTELEKSIQALREASKHAGSAISDAIESLQRSVTETSQKVDMFVPRQSDQHRENKGG